MATGTIQSAILFGQAIKEFRDSANTARSTADDARYVAVRDKAAVLLEAYANDPTNLDLVDRCDEVVVELDKLEGAKLSHLNRDRARANVVYISAQSRRTHFAAYMAGKWTADKRVGGAFKAWMHNSAADGAIALYEAIRGTAGTGDYADLLEVFGEGALYDASRFLALSNDFYTNCAATEYNQAKLSLYRATTAREAMLGISQLKAIKPCATGCHPAEMCWHVDNWKCFNERDSAMKEIIHTYCGNEITKIAAMLENNKTIAENLKSDAGDKLWHNQSNINKVLLLATASGVVLVAYLVLSHAGHADLLKLIESHASIWTGQLAMAGGGGLREIGGGGLIRAMAGGGGLA